jgi:predicted transposase YdaD
MTTRPFDPTTKTLVELGPDDWPVLIGQPRAPTEVIDADVATVSGAADKVLLVRADPPYLLHLEFVAGHEAAELPPALHLRNTLLGYRHKLPVRTVVVLLRPEAASPVLNEHYTVAYPGEPPSGYLRYQVIPVWELPPGPLLAGGLGTLPLAPISRVTEAELPGIIEEMHHRLGRRKVRRRAGAVWAAALLLMGLRYPRGLIEQVLEKVAAMRESVTYQMILEEGEAKGKAEGALEEARKMLLMQGTCKFGAPDQRTKGAVEKIADLARLEDLGVRLLDAAGWDDLLKKPTPRRRNGPRR